jgi:phosphate transport system substrate-binding protein
VRVRIGDADGRRWACAKAAALVLALATLWPAPAPAAEPQPLIFAGAGANLPITRVLVAAFSLRHPDLRIEIPPDIGSAGAVKAVAAGAIALGLVTSPLGGDESRLGLSVVAYARTAIAISVHASVKDANVTYDDLNGIYSGTKSRWGNGRPIAVLTREPGDGSIQTLQQRIPGFKEAYARGLAAKRSIVLFSDLQMSETLARTPNGIGLSDMGAITADNLPLRVLSVSGVFPLPQHVLSGKYELVKTLAFVHKRERLDPRVKTFIEFARSRDSVGVLRLNGYLPPQ